MHTNGHSTYTYAIKNYLYNGAGIIIAILALLSRYFTAIIITIGEGSGASLRTPLEAKN